MILDKVSTPTAVPASQNYSVLVSSPVSNSANERFNDTSEAFGAFETIPDSASETLAARFERLMEQWVKETRFSNSMDDIVNNISLKQIIGLGAVAVPLILYDLKQSPKHWFNALYQLTGVDPIKPADSGNLKKMTNAWLKWGKKEGFIA